MTCESAPLCAGGLARVDHPCRRALAAAGGYRPAAGLPGLASAPSGSCHQLESGVCQACAGGSALASQRAVSRSGAARWPGGALWPAGADLDQPLRSAPGSAPRPAGGGRGELLAQGGSAVVCGAGLGGPGASPRWPHHLERGARAQPLQRAHLLRQPAPADGPALLPGGALRSAGGPDRRCGGPAGRAGGRQPQGF